MFCTGESFKAKVSVETCGHGVHFIREKLKNHTALVKHSHCHGCLDHSKGQSLAGVGVREGDAGDVLINLLSSFSKMPLRNTWGSGS